MVDDEDQARVDCYLWYADVQPSKNIVYAKTDQITGRPRMHSFLKSCPKDKIINHKNHNGLDNRKNNLECVSNSYNIRHGRHSSGKSSHRCIHWHKQRQKWHVQFTRNYFKYSGGMYDSLDDAIEARDRMFKVFKL